MKPTFDIDALRTIVAGTEFGSFARAAVQLGRSQSAVSMQLKRLEEQAGRPLFQRSGRGLVPTEAGDALLVYARRIIELHDEAAAALGATVAAASVRLGLPQDFFEDVMPDAITRFSRQWPGVHVEVRAGRNYALEDEVNAGHLDMALAFFRPGRSRAGTLLRSLPLFWFAGRKLAKSDPPAGVPLVLFDHPCLFRQAALHALDSKGLPWRLSLTTPSLPGVWGALRFGHGVTVRTSHRVPTGIRNVGAEFRLPRLPAIELRMIARSDLSPAASGLRAILASVVHERVTSIK
ncbi:LysR substrate-binding domain-containing protein [Bradyrhizobium sp. CCBAU 53421]|uniref:LysR substrate-binding domain-containing protein n=1 Tax=Bradyrhizobium sp. CCBAU 53421 TaxID=1325120 RepID=UPI00188D77A6|nr:LysR substrate-binding domain-containing protein [Bradyrhizobium sp. CCBAU 53421]QOZ32809.1 permease [Bradyrhizobium sp. CCBAU 53421]